MNVYTTNALTASSSWSSMSTSTSDISSLNDPKAQIYIPIGVAMCLVPPLELERAWRVAESWLVKNEPREGVEKVRQLIRLVPELFKLNPLKTHSKTLQSRRYSWTAGMNVSTAHAVVTYLDLERKKQKLRNSSKCRQAAMEFTKRGGAHRWSTIRQKRKRGELWCVARAGPESAKYSWADFASQSRTVSAGVKNP